MRVTISSLLGVVAGLAIPAVPALAMPTTYSLATTITVPTAAVNPNPGGTFTSFDISFFDPATRLDYVADRSNGGVDIFSAATRTYVGRAGGFVGQQATTSVSGPDGVLIAPNSSSTGGSQLFAGDGNSTLRSYNASNPAAPTLNTVTSTGGTHRVDEMAYSPQTNLLLVANNADAPAFATLVNAATGAIVHGNITIPGAAAGDGLEQPVWDPKTGKFYVSVPSFGGGTDPGGVAAINTDGTVGTLYKFANFGIAKCAPAGLALGASGNLLVGCGTAGTQTVLLNPTGSSGAGSIVATYSPVSGSDELWFDTTSDNYFVTGSVVAGGTRVFDVISDSTNAILQSVSLDGVTVNAHSIAVDPVSGDVYVPLGANGTAGANPICAAGCIAVYAQVVPEPGTLPVLATVLATLAGFAGLLRLRRG